MSSIFALRFCRQSLRLLAGGLALASIGAGLAAALWASDEMANSRMQAKLLSRYAADLHFEVEAGPSDMLRYPDPGPYDERFGYSRLPQLIDRLARQDYTVTGQARMSPKMVELVDRGLFAPYHEKSQAGLELSDCRGDPVFSARFPHRVYEGFESVPSLLVQTLLFIENRELLDASHPTRNPAVEWDRLLKAAIDQSRRLIQEDHPAHGGSTLATQIEKYRHSPEGRTGSPTEKLRQMAAASLRAYLDGEDTTARRRQIVVDYLNTVPLAARAGFGEVNGIGDGLYAWYGRDFDEANQLLSDGGENPDQPAGLLERRALAYKQALSLMVAQRRPSHYLLDGREDLAELTDSHLRILAEAGIIAPALRDAALALPLVVPSAGKVAALSSTDRKASTTLRGRLAGLLGIGRSYELDRLDLAARSTLDGAVQNAVSRQLQALSTPAGAKAAGLYGFRLLSEGDDPGKLTFSFTLYERGEHANQLRVQTDSGDRPFDVNDGARLDLGSTAKLRTLVTYLEIVAGLHARWSGLPSTELAAIAVAEPDAIGRWARDHLVRSEDRNLAAMLDAAMARRYSADPSEVFFTGGGLHRFDNFDRRDDGRIVDAREALRNSINLPFIRMMREIARHYMFNMEGASATILADRADPRRHDFLARFADLEGSEFLARFYRKYQGKSAEQAEALLLAGVRRSPGRLASVYHGLEPETGADELGAFLDERLDGVALSEGVVESLYQRYGADSLSLSDRGYLAGVHPLELWLVGFLRQQPGATLNEVLGASAEQRQQVYGWLFRTGNKPAQDLRIRNVLEREAFRAIHHAWRRLGYPFESLTPSYAASIGASGDRPSALAELMGIIANDGMRLPVARIDAIVLARDTPYETHLGYRPKPAERVMAPEVAATVRKALHDVVEAGTARRLRGTLTSADGSTVPIGGKTGTGDHRFDVHGAGGRLISSRVVNRTATFAFLIGERYYGTIMVYVGEPHAANYRFTSALPTQLLKSLLPALAPMLADGGCRTPAPSPEWRVQAAATPPGEAGR